MCGNVVNIFELYISLRKLLQSYKRSSVAIFLPCSSIWSTALIAIRRERDAGWHRSSFLSFPSIVQDVQTIKLSILAAVQRFPSFRERKFQLLSTVSVIPHWQLASRNFTISHSSCPPSDVVILIETVQIFACQVNSHLLRIWLCHPFLLFTAAAVHAINYFAFTSLSLAWHCK